ncbi:Hypothetical_protein [Hexamita inflata]|uniref:Hypothetical_protein n=1 Tax=Hexamita inflata TaxID=28002 RepID=A0AA86TGF8_9EUKA|nr:Hypothetical protein HINF_LOCUS4216 [Hexamita inflata]
MKPNQEIRSKQDLLNHFGSSQQLEILNLKQMENLLEMNVPPEIWEDASNRNLLSFSQQFVLQTIRFGFNNGEIEYIYLISFFTYLTELSLYDNYIQISNIFCYFQAQKPVKTRFKQQPYRRYISDLTIDDRSDFLGEIFVSE